MCRGGQIIAGVVVQSYNRPVDQISEGMIVGIDIKPRTKTD